MKKRRRRQGHGQRWRDVGLTWAPTRKWAASQDAYSGTEADVVDLAAYAGIVACTRAVRAGLPDDFVQEAVDAAVERVLATDRHRIDWSRPAAAVRGFVALRATWAAGDAFRAWGRWCSRPTASLDEAEHVPDEAAAPDDSAAAAQALARSLDAARRLDPLQARAVEAGMTPGGLREMAAELGVHPSQATRWRRKGLDAIGAAIEVHP